ncbi:MAG: TraM recognition domain-containing protein [Bdellovibrionales bacterium]|nr:TraM recognition domain-containing protein [Bdellovibrionales bacterium]
MSSKNKMNESDQNGVLIVSGFLGALLLLVKVAKYLPMVFLGLLLGLVLGGAWGIEKPAQTKVFVFLTNLLVPLAITVFVFGFPTPGHIYWGIFEYQWGIDLFQWMASTYNHLIETGPFYLWIKKILKLKSLSTVDVQLYFLKVFLLGFFAQFGWFFLNILLKGALSKNLMAPLASNFYQCFRPFLDSAFLSSLRPATPQRESFLKIGFSSLFLLSGFFEQFSDVSPMIQAAALPYFVFPTLGLSILRLTPHLAQSILKYSEDQTQPQRDEILIGHKIGNKNQPVYLTKANLNYHVQLIGGSGAGKTTLIQVILSRLIPQKMGIIFVDLKADFDTIQWIKNEAQKTDRLQDLEFFCLTQHKISKPYNPIKHGTPQEILSQIMNSLDWSEEYYKKTASRALSDLLLALCQIRDHEKSEFTIEDLARYLSQPDELETLAVSEFLDNDTKQTLRDRAESLRSKDGAREISGLLSDLINIYRSSAGPLIGKQSISPLAIDLKDTMKTGKITYFLLNSMADKASCTQLGKLVLQDLIRSVGEIYDEVPENERKPCLLIVDEFASFATDNFIDLLNRARGAKLGIMVAHQSRGDLMKVSPTFCDQLERNCNTKLIFGTDSPDDAEYFASMAGTRTIQKSTMRYKRGLLWDQNTGDRSVRDTEEFVVHPNQIRQLGQGQVLKISRLVSEECILCQIRA